MVSTDDDNRIILKPIPGTECQNDYVNASYIEVYHWNMTKLKFLFVGVFPRLFLYSYSRYIII